MSDGRELEQQSVTVTVTTAQEEVKDKNDDEYLATVGGGEGTEDLLESQEQEVPGSQVTKGDLVNCIRINISDRSSSQDDGESAATTPLERSQEVPSKDSSPTKDSITLKEWSSMINLLTRIPVKAQKGLSTFDLKFTCIATINDEILVIGTNVGIVYWYDRRTDVLDRLRCEGIDAVTSLNCIGTVDYMVAAGNQTGLVTIFQIPRSPNSDEKHANSSNSSGERKTKIQSCQIQRRSQRFLIQDLHKGAITALEWSRNGMKLFSGDQTGHVVLTDIDYDLVQIRSSVLLCENYEIVQLSYARKNLLICSTFRSIIYSLEKKDFNQVGSLARKMTGKFGGLIVSSAWEESPNVYSVRPGGRLWVAKFSGEVQHTIKFKELILSQTQPEIHVIKPLRSAHQLQDDIQFTRLFRFMNDHLVSYYKDILHIIDVRNTIVLGICKELRSVLDIAVNKDEIFVLESSRNVIRLSAKPDRFSFPPNLLNTDFSSSSSSVTSSSGGSTSTSAAFQPHLPDIMSASISDFKFPQESINFLASKFKETSGRMNARINPIINTIKTVIEADIDIEDGQKLLEGGLPSPVIPLEAGDIPALELFLNPPSPPEEPVFVPEPERFQKISNLPFEDVIAAAASKPLRKGKKSARSQSSKSSFKIKDTSSDTPSDAMSLSSAYSNTSGGSDPNTKNADTSMDSAITVVPQRKFSDTTLSSSNSGTGSEVMSMSASENSHPSQKDQLGVPLALSQSWSVGTLVPNKTVTKEELHLKEELLARRLKWPELLPDNVSPDVLMDEVINSSANKPESSPEENKHWKVNLAQNNSSTSAADETTDTDSKTITLENGSSFGTVTQSKNKDKSDNSVDENESNNTSGNCSDADDEEDKYYMDIYTRYRSKDSISSFNSVLSFGPPSGSSYVSAGGTLGGSSIGFNRKQPVLYDATSTATISAQEEEFTNSKEVSGETATSSSTTEEMDSIVESKIVTDEHWRKWRLPTSITQISICDHYIISVSAKGIVYYAKLDTVSLQWKSTNYNASAMIVSPCGSVLWRIYKGDLYSLTNISSAEDGARSGSPVDGGGEHWSKLTQTKDVLTATVQRSFGWIVKQDGSLEFCTGMLETRLIPYFEKVYTPWPIQIVASCGHRLWALTTDGRIVFRTGTSDLNPKGIDWLELRWSTDVPPAFSISCGHVREDGVPSVWFSDHSGNLYFTFEERDSKGLWVPWKVAGSNYIISKNHSACQSSLFLTNIREHVSKSLKSLVLQGSKGGLLLCSSKHSVWFTTSDSSVIYANKSTIAGHYWKPLRVDRGITIPTTWSNIYANSIYKGHGFLWISDSKGQLSYMPPAGGQVQHLDLPSFTNLHIQTFAPAPESLWALTSTGDIHARCDITSMDPIGKNWRQIGLNTRQSTHFVHISCGSEVAWAVDNKGDIFMRTGSLKPPGVQDMSPAWNKVETSCCCRGIFTKVYVGGNDTIVWALDHKKRVYSRQAVFPDYPIGTGWLLVKGIDAEMLSISDTAVWALTPNGDIYRRHGINKTNFVGDYWRKIPGTGNACAITVSLCDELWALSNDGYLLKHSKKIMTLKGWSNGLVERRGRGNHPAKIVLDEEDEDWELVDNSEI